MPTNIGDGPNGAAENPSSTDYTSQSNADLISRITDLERQLREQTALLTRLSTSNAEPSISSHTPAQTSLPRPSPSTRPRRNSSSRRARPFDPTQYSTRHIALKFAYLGARYGGYEHANGNVTPQPTIEEVLWKALRKARLISPELSEGCDESYDVLWDPEARRRRYVTKGSRTGGSKAGGARAGVDGVRLDLNWEGCQYSKCGRTDRGVSAFGQVIGIRVRSNRPVEKEVNLNTAANGVSSGANDLSAGPTALLTEEDDDAMPALEADDLATDSYAKPFDPIADEIPYMSMLNAILPPDIRILAWCPEPPSTFDARFSCHERQYKYFFTNPAFCPTPGPLGLQHGSIGRREGWLDIEAMKQAAKKLEGLHDFRNLCKIDPSKQMSSCVRRITFADVVKWEGGASAVSKHPGMGEVESDLKSDMNGTPMTRAEPEPQTYVFCVNGTAFLWHQVRCMVALLFLVGQGLEKPSIIDELLDIEKNPGRPNYEMADDAPLMLWDCVFSDSNAESSDKSVDSLEWVYAGDKVTLPTLSTHPAKNDGKFGNGAVVDELWTQWRDVKMQEILAGSLLDLALSQGDGTSFAREDLLAGVPNPYSMRTQKVFDGSGRVRLQGRYLPVMEKPKMDSLELINSRWLTRTAKHDRKGDSARGRVFKEGNGEGVY